MVEAADGRRDLLSGAPDVASLKVVGVSGKLSEAAAIAGITANPEGWTRGIRECVLAPDSDGYRVLLLVRHRDNPRLVSRKETDDAAPQASPLGRLAKAEVAKWADRFNGRSILAVVYIDATPGFDHAEVRLFPHLLDEDDAEPQAQQKLEDTVVETAPDPDAATGQTAAAGAEDSTTRDEETAAGPPPAWYTDPTGEASLRWWNGTTWTTHTAN